jgi:hypothetical protein
MIAGGSRLAGTASLAQFVSGKSGRVADASPAANGRAILGVVSG